MINYLKIKGYRYLIELGLSEKQNIFFSLRLRSHWFYVLSEISYCWVSNFLCPAYLTFINIALYTLASKLSVFAVAKNWSHFNKDRDTKFSIQVNWLSTLELWLVGGQVTLNPKFQARSKQIADNCTRSNFLVTNAALTTFCSSLFRTVFLVFEKRTEKQKLPQPKSSVRKMNV